MVKKKKYQATGLASEVPPMPLEELASKQQLKSKTSYLELKRLQDQGGEVLDFGWQDKSYDSWLRSQKGYDQPRKYFPLKSNLNKRISWESSKLPFKMEEHTRPFLLNYEQFDAIDPFVNPDIGYQKERNEFLNLVYSNKSKSATLDEVERLENAIPAPKVIKKPVPKKAFSDIRKSFVSGAKTKWKGLRPYQKVGLGVAAGLGLYGLAFGGKDDNYNTIEGLHPGSNGLGASVIRGMTDFGSGYKGLPSELMGVPLDERILKYRKDVIEDKEKYKEILRKIKEKEEESSANIGDFEEGDFNQRIKVGNFRVLHQLNTTNQKLRQVNLNKFKVNVEDADTLILQRKGLTNLFDKDVVIRLAGIDAPEVAAHEDDSVAAVRYEQAQLGGQKATKALEELISKQKDLSLIIGGEKTYNRYVGAIAGDKSILNVDLVRQGAVTSLPFGEVGKDIILRESIKNAEQQAQREKAGLWSSARYKAIDKVREKVGQPITYNTLTRIDKLAKNLNLAAYSSFIEGLGSEERNLTQDEQVIARRIGYALRKTHGPKKRAYNKFDGLHPGSEGMGAWSMRSHSDFGSGSLIRAGLSKFSKLFNKSLKKNKQAGKEIIDSVAEQYNHPLPFPSGFSKKDIQELATFAKNESVEQFAQRMGTKFQNLGELGRITGGALNVSNLRFVNTTKEELKLLEQFKVQQGNAYIDKNIVNKILGKAIKKEKLSDDFIKTIIFHEATELRNTGALSKKYGKSFLDESMKQHQVALAQEEYFLRQINNKETYNEFKGLRQLSDPYFTGFSGKDDAWNTIEGLRHGGLAEEIRKTLTEFGSGWRGSDYKQEVVEYGYKEYEEYRDKGIRRAGLRINRILGKENVISQRLGNGQKFSAMPNRGSSAAKIRGQLTEFKEEFASRWDKFKSLAVKFMDGTEDLAFRKARKEAVEIGIAGEGMFGKATLMKGTYKGKEFKFIRKTGDFGEEELQAQLAAQGTVAPSVYGYGKNKAGNKYLDMELFEGELIANIDPSRLEGIEPSIMKSIQDVHKTGYAHRDVHLGNMFLVNNNGKQEVGLIDFGLATKDTKNGLDWIAEDITSSRNFISRRIQSNKSVDDAFGEFTGSNISNKIQEVTEHVDPFAAAASQPKLTLANIDPFQDKQQSLKRMRNFNNVSQSAVGSGFKAAHNAGRGHKNFNSGRSGF